MAGYDRRQVLKALAAASAAALAGGAAVEGFFLGPGRLTVTRHELRLPRLPEAFDGMTVAQLTDVHLGELVSHEFVGEAVEMTNSLSPDLVVLTGDYITAPRWRHGPAAAERRTLDCVELLSRLQAKLGVFAAVGNHDYYSRVRNPMIENLRSSSIALVQNAARVVEREGQRVWIVGTDDALNGRPDLRRALAGVPRDECKLLLMHEPDFADYAARYPIDLQLSGHSHGGQVRLPGVGPLVTPTLANKYREGLFHVGAMQLYVSRGVGMIGIPVRFNCPPEISLFTLRRAHS